MISSGILRGYNALSQLREGPAASLGCAKVDAAFSRACRASTAHAKLQALSDAFVESRLVSFASVCLVNERAGSFGLGAISGVGIDYFPPVLEEAASPTSSSTSLDDSDPSASCSMDGLQRSSQRSFSLYATTSFALRHSGWAVEDVVRTHAPWFCDCTAPGTCGLPKEGEWLKRSGQQSILAVPCMHDGDVVAVLLLGAAHTRWHPALLAKLQALAHSITPFAVTAGEQLDDAFGSSSKPRRFQSINGIAASMTYELINLDKILAARLVGPPTLVAPGEAASASAACREAETPAMTAASAQATTAAASCVAAAAAAHALDVSMKLPPILMHPVGPVSPSISNTQSSSCGCKEQSDTGTSDMRVLLGEGAAATASPMYSTSQRLYNSKPEYACAVATPAAGAATPSTESSSPSWRPEPTASTTCGPSISTSYPTCKSLASNSNSLVHELPTFQLHSQDMSSSRTGVTCSSAEQTQVKGAPTMRHMASPSSSNSTRISGSRLQKVTRNTANPTQQPREMMMLHSVDGDFEVGAGPSAPWHACTSINMPERSNSRSSQQQCQPQDVLVPSFWTAVQAGALEASPAAKPYGWTKSGLWALLPAECDTSLDMAARLAGSAAYVAAYATTYRESLEADYAATAAATAAALCATQQDSSPNRSTSLPQATVDPGHIADMLAINHTNISAEESVADVVACTSNSYTRRLREVESSATTNLVAEAAQHGHMVHGSAHADGLHALPAGSRFMISELDDPAGSPYASHAQDGGTLFLTEDLIGQHSHTCTSGSMNRSWTHAQTTSNSSMPFHSCTHDVPREQPHHQSQRTRSIQHVVNSTYLEAGASHASSNQSTLLGMCSVRYNHALDLNNMSTMSNASTHWLARTHGFADLSSSSATPVPAVHLGRTMLNSLPEYPPGCVASGAEGWAQQGYYGSSQHTGDARVVGAVDSAAGWAARQTSDFAVMLQ